MKNVRSSLNRDLILSPIHSVQIIEFPSCHNGFTAACQSRGS